MSAHTAGHHQCRLAISTPPHPLPLGECSPPPLPIPEGKNFIFTKQAPHFIPLFLLVFPLVDFPLLYFLLKFCLSRIHFKCLFTMNIPLSQKDVPSSLETGSVSSVLQTFVCMAYSPTSSQQNLFSWHPLQWVFSFLKL